MSKSGRGSQENHGKNVKQKAGLNEETLRNSLPSGRGEYQEMAETPAVLLNESPGSPPPADSSRRYTRILLILFLCTLPLVNPIVHGDGVGYYAYVRAPLIQHNLDFTGDYQSLQFRVLRLGLLQDRDFSVGILPKREKILIRGASLGHLTLQSVRTP